MSKSIQLKDSNNEKIYPHPYYPIGSIYLSVNNTNPSKWFGGTWISFGTGRVLVGVDTSQNEFKTVEKTGGSKTHDHSLLNAYATINYDWIENENRLIAKTKDQSFVGNRRTNSSGMSYSDGSFSSNNAVDVEGKTNSSSNLQPYITCYMWKRTA